MPLNIIKNLLHITKKKPWKLEKPKVIQFPVNDICNARCEMCNIWMQKKGNEISPEQLAQALNNELFTEVKSVGINGGEPTLRHDLNEIIDTLFINLPNLRNISLITNALNADKTIRVISNIGGTIKKHQGKLDVMVSVDGVDHLHDKVRGRKGNFSNSEKVLDFCKGSKIVDSTRVGCTVLDTNVYGLHELLEWAISKGVYIKFRLAIPHQRLYKSTIPNPKRLGKTTWLDRSVFNLNLEEKIHFAEFLDGVNKFYETSLNQQFFYKSLINQLIHNTPRKAGCDWQHKGVTLSSKGELLYCAVESDILGNAITEDSESLYFSNEHHAHQIYQSKCSTCAHDYVGLPPTSIYLKTIALEISSILGLKPGKILSTGIFKAAIKQRNHFRYLARQHTLKKSATQDSSANHPAIIEDFKNILICGWYGTETLGDKAILAGVVETLNSLLPKTKITVVSLHNYISELTRYQMPELQATDICSVEEALSLAQTADLVVFGGGPIMGYINELADMEAIFKIAHNSTTPTLIAGCGVGPLGEKHHHKSIFNILKFANKRIYRDQKSKDYASELGINTIHDTVTEDPAFTWLKNIEAKAGSLRQEPKKNSTSPTLLLGLRDWPYQQYAAHLQKHKAEEIKASYEKEIVATLIILIEKFPELQIVPLPMCTNHFGGDDRFFYTRLFRNSPEILNRLDRSVMHKELTPKEYVEKYKTADVALTMRFHSLVFAIGLDIPCVAIDYTLGKGKVYALAERFSIPNQSLRDISSNFVAKELEKQINYPSSIKFSPSFPEKMSIAISNLLTTQSN